MRDQLDTPSVLNFEMYIFEFEFQIYQAKVHLKIQFKFKNVCGEVFLGR